MIHSLLHVGMTVPDLEIGRAFYELFGLEARACGNDLVLRCPERAQDQIRLIQGPKKRLSYVSLGTDEAGMQAVKSQLERAGVVIVAAPFRVPFGGIWFQDPHGDWLNVQIEEAAPSLMAAPPELNVPGRYRRIGTRACDIESMQKRARPRRLGHLIKFSPDVDRSVDFYMQVLGLRMSDRAQDILAFLRGAKGGDHHLLAFAKSTHTGLHHLSFEVGDFDEIEIGAQTMVRAGYKSAFGPGRHVGGSNYFHYIRDPWNSLVEYFWDIDIIPEDDSGWVPLNVTPDELTAVWASEPPPPEFPMNFELPD
ncbi:VOC family protein [Cupriavidus necator]|uniref:VOC family protein n=1 Tax=Cupriavidus necator TaxID=106590 RepID=UPI0039C40441